MISASLLWNSSGTTLSVGTSLAISQYAAEYLVERILSNPPHPNQASLGAHLSYVDPLTLLETLYGSNYLTKPLLSIPVEGVIVDSLDKDSPVGEYLDVGDLVTHINGQPIGFEGSDQVSVGTALLKVIPGQEIVLIARLKSESYSTPHPLRLTTRIESTSTDVPYSNTPVVLTSTLVALQNEVIAVANGVMGFAFSYTEVKIGKGVTKISLVSLSRGIFSLNPGKYSIIVEGVRNLSISLVEVSVSQIPPLPEFASGGSGNLYSKPISGGLDIPLTDRTPRIFTITKTKDFQVVLGVRSPATSLKVILTVLE